MPFSLNQLETFILVVQSGSFSAAARRLRKAQSTVSTTIANLEIELGLELFDRSTKSPSLTPEGRTYLEAAESLLRQCQDLEELANTLSLGLESRLDILVDDAVPTALVDNALKAMSREYPQIRLNLLRPVAEPGLNFLTGGRADLGLIPASGHYGPEISFRRLGDISLANVAPADHPLAGRPAVGFAQLHGFRQIVYAPHEGELPTGEYLSSGKSWSVNSYSLLLRLLKKGLGWAVCPRHLISEELASGEIIELNLAAYPVTEWLVGLDMVWSSNKKTGVAADWLKNFLISKPKPGLLNTSRSLIMSR